MRTYSTKAISYKLNNIFFRFKMLFIVFKAHTTVLITDFCVKYFFI